MYSISLQNFRGFHNIDSIQIRPITLLIGDNSAGKSSFLAGLRYILDFIAGREFLSFNKDPFHLGTFQQIAHYRGGKAGRAREFCISLTGSVKPRKHHSHPQQPIDVTVRLVFTQADSQAAISSVDFHTPEGRINVRTEADDIVFSFTDVDGSSYDFKERFRYRGVSRADFGRYWHFLLNDMNFRLERASGSTDTPSAPPEAKKSVAKLANYYAQLSHSLATRVEATSAIRTKPLRTYTPGSDVPDAEGTHVPFEIAKLSRSNKELWRRVKRDLEVFGNTSEMFKAITVKSFGDSASDPFQLQLSLEGRRMNLVDLGYGVSQVLPILYSLARSGTSRTRHLIQQPEVHLHPKAQAALGEYFVDSWINSKSEFVIETHSDFIVDRVRRAIFRKKLGAADVSIVFFERRKLENTATVIVLDEEGNPVNPPPSYRNFFLAEQLRIMGIDECL